MKRHPSLLDPRFVYTPSVATNIAATFERLCPGWRTRKASLPGDRTVVALRPKEKRK